MPFTPDRRRTTGDGLMLHTVDTITDKFGVTRSYVRVAHDVRYNYAANLLPVIPGHTDVWAYGNTYREPNSLMSEHVFIFHGEPLPVVVPFAPDASFDFICDECGEEFVPNSEDGDEFTLAFRQVLKDHMDECQFASFRLGGF